MKTVIPEIVYQGETNECGLACISMLAASQGIDLPLEQLRKHYPASAHGTSLARLCSILEGNNIPVYPVQFGHQELDELPLPAILHYGASHYVVIAWRKGSYVCVLNPAIGEQVIPTQALKREISGYALVLDKERPVVKTSDTPVKRSSFWNCMSLKETAGINHIYTLMVAAFIVSLTLFIMPTMVNSLINQAFTSQQPLNVDFIFFLLAFIGSTLLALGLRVFTERMKQRFVKLRSASGFSTLLRNEQRFFDKRAPGEIFSRFIAWQMAALSKIELDNGLRTDWIIALIALCVMGYINPLLSLISFGCVTVMGLISLWAVYRDRFYTQQMQVRSAAQNEYVLESLQGITTIKSASLEAVRKQGYVGFSGSLLNTLKNKNIYEQIKNGLYQLVGSVEMLLFMMVALPLVITGTISFGAFFAYSFIHQIFISYITRIFFAVIQKNQLYVIDKRASELFDSVPEPDDSLPGSSENVVTFERELVFSGLNYEYEPDMPVLSNISLHLKKGSVTAIKGQSGIGKSTLLRLMAGILQPTRGEIRADGHALKGKQLKDLVFLQSQEDILFNASVLQNITLFDTNYDESKLPIINAILRGLELDSVVDALPGGVNALIRDSHSGLSLGQRQRLLLARALYNAHPVLLLDEPTANLDEKTAQAVVAWLVHWCKEHDKTLVIVTHSDTILDAFDAVWLMTKDDFTLHPMSKAILEKDVANETLVASH